MTTTLAKRPVTRPQALTLITCITVGCGGVTVPQHELAVHGGGGGNGTLFGDPVGINCSITAGAVSNDCTAMYDEGTPVTLAAAPEARSTFVGWSGGCDSTESCHVTMSEATNVTATFELIRLELTVDGTGTGDGGVTSNPSGLDCTIVAGVASNDCIRHRSSWTEP